MKTPSYLTKYLVEIDTPFGMLRLIKFPFLKAMDIGRRKS